MDPTCWRLLARGQHCLRVGSAAAFGRGSGSLTGAHRCQQPGPATSPDLLLGKAAQGAARPGGIIYCRSVGEDPGRSISG